MAEKKTCIIRNTRFTWVLEVDGQEIPFTGAHVAEYFRKHYSNLGYKVTIIRKMEDI